MSDATDTTQMAHAADKAKIWPMYRAVVGLGFLCGFIIVGVYEGTKPIIQRNRIEMREQAIKDVLPGAVTTQAFMLNEQEQFVTVPSAQENGGLLFAGYDESDQLVGLAIEAQGMGYQDVVRLLYGYSFESETILGIRVLESRETPGLGDRIESDPVFLKNFGTLDVRLTSDGSSVANPIEFVKPGEKTDDWQIDGISGATITSRATATLLRESSTSWLPKVNAQKDAFLKGKRSP
ncbi:MAG: FMN-binding protein [Verrucomicrobia bacterium]|nr:FMN-binding protein [Verrucomicrobiota bacterium]